jgi:hypothetical protein
MSEIRKYVSVAERYAKVPYPKTTSGKDAPPKVVTSPGGRTFTLGKVEREKPRYKGDIRWDDTWPVLLDGKEVASLSRNLNYGTTPDGKPKWQGSLTKLNWSGKLPPTGLGFDVSGCDSAKECLEQMARNADGVLDWREGKEVRSIYSKTGSYKSGAPSLPPGTSRG